ncbi:RNA-binding motif, single-stranded-interacting protein 1 isoform X7 [Ixodes scapularis]
MKDEKPEVQLNGLAKEEERAAVAPVNGDQPGSIQTTAASLDVGGKPEAGTKVSGGPPVGGVLQRPGPSTCPSVLASPPMFGAAPVNGQGAKGLRGGPPPLALAPQGLAPQGMNPQGMTSQVRARCFRPWSDRGILEFWNGLVSDPTDVQLPRCAALPVVRDSVFVFAATR